MTSTDTNPVDFSVADVLAWARTKPADETYRYTDGSGGCALCQFLIETGRATVPRVWPRYFDNKDGAWFDGFGSARVAYSAILERPLQAGTFGALATRLEALIPKPSVWTLPDTYLTDQVRIRADA